MSKLAYHAGHFGSGSVGAIGRHNWQKRGEYDEHSNQDIDPTRSKDNILLQVPESGSLYQAAKERIETACTGRVTKASNWVTETIVYPPEDVVKRNDPQEIERYFQDVLAWHQLEFGFDNVLAAVVHMDETTPHMHTDIVPLTEDGRLSSKQVFARKELNRHHTELAAFLQGRGWDVQRGESTRNKQIRAKTVPAFKKAAEAEKTALVADLAELMNEVEFLEYDVEAHEATVRIYEEKEMDLQVKCEAKEEQLQKASEGLGKIQERLDFFREKLETMRVEKDDLTTSVRSLRQEKRALNSALEDVRGQISDAHDALEAVDRAIKKKSSEGVALFGSMAVYKERIAEQRVQMEKEKRLNLLEKFVSLPQIKSTWEKFCAIFEQNKGKSKGRSYGE